MSPHIVFEDLTHTGSPHFRSWVFVSSSMIWSTRPDHIVGWVGDLFVYVHGQPITNKYESICTYSQVCLITPLGTGVLETDGKLHYEYEEEIKLVLEDYLD